ncbi:MAG: M1 family metallopeptidase, partial [Thermoanaerobaculia bacterium]|nr:M1 family metallopeptidase [Thermoanaerobaculia bacterium]
GGAGEDEGTENPRTTPDPATGTMDLTAEARHVTPDDDNHHDRTVLAVPLPARVLPGETVRVAMDWRARVPRTFARTGRRGDFYFIAHWFPKLGVFEGPEGWNCHQYHANTEYYSDYGVYDVSITVPEGFVVGATGREEERSREDGVVTRRFVQPDVHAFTWTAFPGFLETGRRFEVEGLPPVDVRFLYQPEHAHQVERHFHAAFAALELYGRWYGPYPYDHLTVVDPAWGSGAGGMEYPTLFTSGTRIFKPFGSGSPEGVTVHEVGHQFWYGVVGNNEFEHAWLDEGLNTFSTGRVMQEVYGPSVRDVRYLRPPGTDWRGFLPVLFRGIREEPLARRLRRYRENADWDVPSDPTFRYYPEAHGDVSYSKTALWLATLEGYLGWDVLREILSTFYDRWSFRHPGPEDFFAVANEVAAERFDDERADLGWFFDQVHRSAVTFDYRVVRADSFAADVEGFVREGGEMVYRAGDAESGEDAGTWRSEVVVRRSGQGYFPVDILLTFEDGTEVREPWEGRERWRLFVHEGPSKLVSATVDPDRILRLDLHPSNNARLVEPAGPLASVKWAGKWMLWLQDLMQTFAFFV